MERAFLPPLAFFSKDGNNDEFIKKRECERPRRQDELALNVERVGVDGVPSCFFFGLQDAERKSGQRPDLVPDPFATDEEGTRDASA